MSGLKCDIKRQGGLYLVRVCGFDCLLIVVPVGYFKFCIKQWFHIVSRVGATSMLFVFMCVGVHICMRACVRVLASICEDVCV